MHSVSIYQLYSVLASVIFILPIAFHTIILLMNLIDYTADCSTVILVMYRQYKTLTDFYSWRLLIVLHIRNFIMLLLIAYHCRSCNIVLQLTYCELAIVICAFALRICKFRPNTKRELSTGKSQNCLIAFYRLSIGLSSLEVGRSSSKLPMKPDVIW